MTYRVTDTTSLKPVAKAFDMGHGTKFIEYDYVPKQPRSDFGCYLSKFFCNS